MPSCRYADIFIDISPRFISPSMRASIAAADA